MAIYKLRHNIPLTETDYQTLSDILTKELGSTEDYQREYQDLPFCLLVRKVDGMEHDAAMRAFSEFISSQSLDQQQIVYVNKIVDYILQNGYFDKVTALMDALFDKPRSFVKLFD